MLKICVNPNGLEGLLEYGWSYWVEKASCGAVWVTENGIRFLCSGSRFR